ncbi:hypothetical protein yc1106_08379 [Curvularia clavata]|uniref:Uncharacterized protein n=1 Tax=Curvularia clavata TaxID=95742 RepID=A0A9Q8ZF60_CURCL|nr:hypothetical protein yc1106_08379 [Curvularia clavata]
MSPKFTVFSLLLAGLATAKDIPRMPKETLASPTVPLTSAITPAPYVNGNLFKRLIATCGFIRGDSASPVTCGAGYNCVTTIRTALGFACCNNVECSNNWGACRAYGQTDCMGYDLDEGTCSSILGSILQCSQEAPYCYQYALSTGRGATDTYFSLACGTTSEDVLMLATATNAAKQTAAANPNPGNDVSEALPGFPSIPGISSSTGTAKQPSDPSSTGSSGSTLSTKWIVIISVVGVVVLAVCVGVGCCCYRTIRPRLVRDIDPSKIPQANYQPTVTASVAQSVSSWSRGTPLHANPNVPPSEPGSEWGGRSMNGAPRRPMTTMYEQD